MQTTIVKWGNSQGIRLPKRLLESVNLANDDMVDVIAENGNIIIKKLENKKTHIPLAQRLKDWNGQPYEVAEEDREWLDAESAGEEAW